MAQGEQFLGALAVFEIPAIAIRAGMGHLEFQHCLCSQGWSYVPCIDSWVPPLVGTCQ